MLFWICVIRLDFQPQKCLHSSFDLHAALNLHWLASFFLPPPFLYQEVYLHSWSRLRPMLAQLCDLCLVREESLTPSPMPASCFHRDSVLHAQGEWNTSAALLAQRFTHSGYLSLCITGHLLQDNPGHTDKTRLAIAHAANDSELQLRCLWSRYAVFHFNIPDMGKQCTVPWIVEQQSVWNANIALGVAELIKLAFCKTMPHSLQSPLFNI